MNRPVIDSINEKLAIALRSKSEPVFMYLFFRAMVDYATRSRICKSV